MNFFVDQICWLILHVWIKFTCISAIQCADVSSVCPFRFTGLQLCSDCNRLAAYVKEEGEDTCCLVDFVSILSCKPYCSNAPAQDVHSSKYLLFSDRPHTGVPKLLRKRRCRRKRFVLISASGGLQAQIRVSFWAQRRTDILAVRFKSGS